MATFRTGDMWSAYPESDLFCLTTNAAVSAKGELVMGRGIALEAKQRFPALPRVAGTLLRDEGLAGSAYGMLVLPRLFERIALFQVKYHWREQANLELIDLSVDYLRGWVTDFRAAEGRDPRVHLAFPGIGNGNLARETVLPLVETLPDCVTIWEYGDAQG